MRHAKETAAITQGLPGRESGRPEDSTDMSRFERDYPNWDNITKDLDYIFNELIEHWIEIYNLDVDLSERDYFKKLRKDSIY